ncbi:class I SAM-dependent methyltransferase [Myroides marinus]|uniref:class I SAM-dependent methyltransferase n=1 Tax=Myroides marinus TaxID=703342 RepID=UPI00257713E6|nr:class I SAM-dependent methyltransferase [Myroides marinus]MDM1377712.1 class I SAM-dependent methyltransferase [Myroides marinus]MDM1385084.1 class I SAM-dependent methyltransferase [Myroides marinus]MDM1392196.1 class I SAM-dependent methyltransferase [Myroides marinus]
MKKKKEITIDSYNKTANEYFNIVSEFNVLPELLDFSNLIKQNGTILDLGCGPGHHSKYFSDLGFKVTGIDLSSEMIEIAKKVSEKSTFKIMDILHIDFKKGTFDGIWASASLLHIPKNKIKNVLKNLKEILVEGGILYISLKDGDGDEIFIDKRYGNVEKYYTYYKSNEILDLLQTVGFNKIEISLKDKRSNYDTSSWLHIFCQNIN